MTAKIEAKNFIEELDRFDRVKKETAALLKDIANILSNSESVGDEKSGRLELAKDLEDLEITSKNLNLGVFRLLVLGDMKRGKSTFLNALIGENILPSDVNPCTALLTILRYGREKQVTIYFNDKTAPEKIDFTTFKNKYTIDPTEAKRLQQEKKLAFPNINYAVVEYPLPLLEKGIEIVDSPGLNDTEARNELSLGYINNCHAILFVMRATQPCTLAERRYLENYIKDRGVTIFFLINAWDQVQDSLIDPEDEEELAEAEGKLRRVFKANLGEYCEIEGKDLYEQRVFPVCSLIALRKRLKNKEASLAGTGFPQFMGSLNEFLTRDKASVQLRQAKNLAEQTVKKVSESVDRRIPLLEEDINRLKEKINSVQPEFELLQEICGDFRSEIRKMRDRKATKISNSFSEYVISLGDTFEADFLHYQPDLSFTDFFSGDKREQFEKALTVAFEQYINDRLSQWTLQAEKEMDLAFAKLSQIAMTYGASYSKVTDKITEKLTGHKIKRPISGASEEDDAPAWAKWAAGIFSLARGNIAGVAMAGAGFDWKNIVLNFITVFSIGSIISALTGIVMGPLGIALLGLGVGLAQADRARQELVKATKKELVKYLPQVASEQSPRVKEAINECFDVYEEEVTQRMNNDINSRQAELDNLVKQKQSTEIDRSAEVNRLQQLQKDIESKSAQIKTAYLSFVGDRLSNNTDSV
ncbi:MAG: dynamin family protein [Prochloraceae cyanobacterium]|nr:dynamin family protein [Prochloraceae cyanobacterium]